MNVPILPAFSAAVDLQLFWVCLVAIIRVTNSYGARMGPKVLKDHTVRFTATPHWHTAVQSCYFVEVLICSVVWWLLISLWSISGSLLHFLSYVQVG
jgi:hypothetical protein